jgi:hypothetical protein
MAVMASWNGKRWEVSPSRIMAIEGLSTGYKLKNTSNTDSEGKAPSDVRGLELMQLSFTTHISDAVGVDVRPEIDSWAALIGESAPFILGDRQFGESDFRLTQVGLSNTAIDDFGRIRESELSMQFEEYAGEAAKDKPKSTAAAAKTAASTPGVAAPASPKASPGATVVAEALAADSPAGLSATKSALGIGPTSGDKAAKKPDNPQMSKGWRGR